MPETENVGVSASNQNIYSFSAFIPNFDGSFPVQDFIQEVKDAAKLGSWNDTITLKVAKSKIQGPIADIVRNRHDLNHAATFKDFSENLISALNTEKPVSIRLQDLMTCVQQPAESVDAYATRIRQKSKSLTEWDATSATQELKNRTATAAFIKGLKPQIRQYVVPMHPSDFEAAILLARSHELSESLMPSSNITPSPSPTSVAAIQNVPDPAMLDIQKRVASLELSAAQPSSSRGRGHYPANGRGRGGRGRGRQPSRQNFQNQSRFRQSRSWAGPSGSHIPYRTSASDFSRSENRQAYHSGTSRHSSCHCCCDRDRRHRSHSRHNDDNYGHSSRSPCHQRRFSRSNSRSPSRNHQRQRHFSRTPSLSPARSHYQSPNGYRSRH